MFQLKGYFWQYFSCSSVKKYFYFISNDWKEETVACTFFWGYSFSFWSPYNELPFSRPLPNQFVQLLTFEKNTFEDLNF